MSWIALIVAAIVLDALGWFPLMYSLVSLVAVFLIVFFVYEILGLD